MDIPLEQLVREERVERDRQRLPAWPCDQIQLVRLPGPVHRHCKLRANG